MLGQQSQLHQLSELLLHQFETLLRMPLQFWLRTRGFAHPFFVGSSVDFGFGVLGDPMAIYAALTGNQRCVIYDQCAAADIDCGIGSCVNPTSSDQQPTCRCPSPLVLTSISTLRFDCLCPNPADFYDGTSCRSRPTTNPGRIRLFSHLIL